ncbi:MAG: hypothetical protein KJ749_06285 [Planctomycetes bacterium]|nr:hypothetical protein [Planctomycetota bacterium]
MKTNMFVKITVATTVLLLPLLAFATQPPVDIQKNKILHQAHRMQIPFIENVGQIDNRTVSFYAHTFGGTVFVHKSGTLTYSLPGNGTHVVITEIFPEKQGATVAGTDPSPATVNTFTGNDKSKWKSHIPTYARVSVGAIHDGIDLTLKAYANSIEKLFTISPGARPDAIRITLTGAKTLNINAKGELQVGTAGGFVTFTRPVAYQNFGSEQKYVEAAYVVNQETYGFHVGTYDTSRPLIIDPLLASTFIGGSDRDHDSTIALDDSHVYVTGRTGSSSFPTTSGAYDESYNGDNVAWGDVFVIRCDKDLSTIEASTFIGGSDGEWPGAIAIDESYVYVTGSTESSDFPTTIGAYDEGWNLHSDTFVLRLTKDLATLDASTFLGGWNAERSYSLVNDGNAVYVTGWTASHDFPTTPGAYRESDHGGTNVYEVFVSRLTNDLTTLEASTFMGGSSHDVGQSLDVEGNQVYVGGSTASSDFCITSGAYDQSYNGGGYDGFVARLSSDLTTLEASTFIGGSGAEGVNSVIGGDSYVYAAGRTDASTFPTTSGAYDETYNGGEGDVFIARCDRDLLALEASTLIGGSGLDQVYTIIVDGGYVFLTGGTGSADFPTTEGAYDESYNGGEQDAFISRVDSDLTTLGASTLIGGSGYDYGRGMALDEGCVYVAGVTESSDFPTTGGAYDESYNGGDGDGFIVKLDKELSGPPAIPTLSEWGVIAMALVTVTAGTLVFARRQRQVPA